ncbi:MAG TPA: Type 1 glutamine amidotransferase-like domain-containing protein [Candidatus Limiplasma sp.]|nr:Type 1 glutamine amidotransferase-like domain-containing protein [Candidatus Limiplasma sp.]
MRVLLTSAGLETQEIQARFTEIMHKDMALVKALFIPTAAINAGAIEVLPKCMHDLLKCGIREQNITVYDLHAGMKIEALRQYDVVYLCGGDTRYLLERINDTGFNATLTVYIRQGGFVIGVSAGSLIFANNLTHNLGLIDTKLEVHCAQGEKRGTVKPPLKRTMQLTNTSALFIHDLADGMEIIGE